MTYPSPRHSAETQTGARERVVCAAFPGELQSAPRDLMITDPALAIKREIHQLIDLQIETLRRDSPLNSSELLDYSARSERIRSLYGKLDRMGRTKFDLRFCQSILNKHR